MKLTERQREDVYEFWQRVFDIMVATTPPEKLYRLRKHFMSGAAIQITRKQGNENRKGE